MVRRFRARRTAGAALALCLAAVVARPAAAQHEHHAVYPRVRAVIQAHYPSPTNPSVLDWAEHIAAWNSLQILALQGILDIATLIGTCGSEDDPSCREDRARYAVRSQVLGLEDACPVGLPAGERASCLVAFYQELGTLEQALHPWGQRFLMELSGLWRAYAAHGRPDISRFRAIPELRRLAEMDTVMLFVFHLRVTALEEKILLLEQIERELAGQDWAQEVPRGGLFVTSARMQLAHAELQQEQLWSYRSYSLASAGWEGPFREWLELTRHGTISASGLDLTPVRPQAVLPRPPDISVAGLPDGTLRRPPAPPSAVPDRVRRGLYLALARDSAVAKERRSTIWVRGGRPIVLPGPGQPPDRSEPPPEPSPGPDPSPGPEPLPEPLPIDPRLARRTMDFMDEGYWMDRIADVLERSPVKEVRDVAIRLRALSTATDVLTVLDAIRRRDVVGTDVATIKTVLGLLPGGLVGIVVMEMTGFDEKLRGLERKGYSVPAVMNYSAEVAAAIISPFSFGRPAPSAFLGGNRGPTEQASEAEIRNYEQALLEAAEEQRRKQGRFSIFR